MKKYVKINEENKLEYAPKNMILDDGTIIINFSSDEDIMLQYGYKLLVPAEKSPNHLYIITYEEHQREIIEIAQIDEEAEQERDERRQEEEEEIRKKLHMTRGDFFESFILATGLSVQQLRDYIENLEDISELEKTLYLNRFDNALDFYRGYPIIDTIGEKLGIGIEQLDDFFRTKDYHSLIPNRITQ